MKKLGLAAISFILIAAVYYFTAGSKQLTTQMKSHVDAQIASLQSEGFLVEGKELGENKEHVVIVIDDPKKITNFLNTHGLQTTIQDVTAMKGAKLGVDITYLADAYSSASFDIYPMALPTSVTSGNLSEDDKKLLDIAQKLIDKKTFLVHVDINKLGNAFKGYMKNVDEVIEAEEKVSVKLTDFTFDGAIKEEKITDVAQQVKHFSLKGGDDLLAMHFNNMKTTYVLTGDSKYNYTTDYAIEDMGIEAKGEFNLGVKDVTMSSTSKEVNGLASMTANTTVGSINFEEGPKATLLKTLTFDMNANNFDMKALESLQTIDPENDKEMMKALQGLIAHGVDFEIPDFSVKEIEIDKQQFDGFKLTSKFEIDKSLNLAALEQNPMAAISAMNADLDLTLSNQLFGLLAQHPQAVMAMMFIQPKDVNGNKVYKVQLKDGNLAVNGKPMM